MASSSSSSSSPAAAAASSAAEEELTLVVKWSGKEYTVPVSGVVTVGELKRRIFELTNVRPERQKLLFSELADKSKLPDDTTSLSQLPLKSSLKITMIGTLEEDIVAEPLVSPVIADDFELGPEEVADREVNQRKLQRRIDQYKIHILNACRKGKKLLVLDIDYTLCDHRSAAENNPDQLRRPYLHEFLTAAYEDYDIMIWSATSMKWANDKMQELGIGDHPNYKITALLDHLAMITVQSKSGTIFECKPLGLIWAQFPQFYTSRNTIMFDDLERNFMMNPQNGLLIKPFRKPRQNEESDQELSKLTKYLLHIAKSNNFSGFDHGNWEILIQDKEDAIRRPRHS